MSEVREIVVVPPRWASEIGEDRHGLFAVLEVKAARQRMRWVPPGSYVQGSPETEAGRYEDEAQRRVTFTRGFWLGETPVTQPFYEAVTGQNPSRVRLTPEAAKRGAELPVEQVSFEDVQGFIAKLRDAAPGFMGRLPSEAEWEYACRAGTTTATYAGDLEILGISNAPMLDGIAWYSGNCGRELEVTGETSCDVGDWKERQYPKDKKGGTHAVRRKPPNAWGLYDMLGNVLEWCEDRLEPTDEESKTASNVRLYPKYEGTDVVDPRPRDEGSGRVCRGGSWYSFARGVRAANRLANAPGNRGDSLGFRLSETPV